MEIKKNKKMISKIISKLIVILIFLYAFQMFGQEKEFSGDPDSTFKTARDLASNNQRKQAQDSLLFILTKYPDYNDVRIYLATTYGWDGEYKKAKREFEVVLEKDPKNKPAWQGIIQNEFWANTPFIALEMSDRALEQFPKDLDIMFLKAKAQEQIEKTSDALDTVNLILKDNPDNQKAKELISSLQKKASVNTIGIIVAADFYSAIFKPIQYHSLKYGRQTKLGFLTAKLNLIRKLNTNGEQLEIEMYPKIIKGLSGYINAAYSNSPLFPKTKYGAELFKALSHGLETSLGFQTLNYSSTTNFFTASVSWYTGKNYWSFRPYLTPGDLGTSFSGALTYRKYRSDAYNYFSVSAGIGYSPELNQFNSTAVDKGKIGLKSQKINLGYNFTSSNQLNIYKTQFGITHQEELFSPGNYYWAYFAAFTWDVRFR